jgi:dTDP-4-dehydrorhamnose 3,5-epimerase
MKIHETPLVDLIVAETTPHTDPRGAFARLFCERELASVIGGRPIVQINHSLTRTVGAIRGLHYQRLPNAEMKLVRCLRGRVWDVAIDLRRGSSTFLSWFAQELTPENQLMMVIPEGFCHGFQALEPQSELLYLHTAHYTPESEGGLRFNDARLGINWPLEVTDLSDRDAAHPLIGTNFCGIDL